MIVLLFLVQSTQHFLRPFFVSYVILLREFFRLLLDSIETNERTKVTTLTFSLLEPPQQFVVAARGNNRLQKLLFLDRAHQVIVVDQFWDTYG